ARFEVELLLEEMRRVITYSHWKATWWRQRADGVPNADDETRQGIHAYAMLRAWREEGQAARLTEKWSPLMRVGRELLDGL
ncbi:hypothetical protein BDZ89DRAFT_934537, partial [Hymenopellis radicata]